MWEYQRKLLGELKYHIVMTKNVTLSYLRSKKSISHVPWRYKEFKGISFLGYVHLNVSYKRKLWWKEVC